MNTLPDIVAPGLRLLSIGLNPSLPSVVAGFYFANPRNRFWKALNASRLVDRAFEPGRPTMQQLLDEAGIGFTDVVKRPTRGAGDLKAADYRDGAPRLLALIEAVQPDCAWFHGKLAYKNFLRHAALEVQDDDGWGAQSLSIAATRVFVTPNPSPANAAYSLGSLIDWYNSLADFVAVHPAALLRP